MRDPLSRSAIGLRLVICTLGLGLNAFAEVAVVRPAYENIVYYEDLSSTAISSTNVFGVAGVASVAGVPLYSANTNGYRTGNSTWYLESQLGAPAGAIFASYGLGEVLDAPPGVDLDVDPVITGDNVVWIDYAQALLAVDSGAATVDWTLLAGGTQTVVYTVSPNPKRRPVRIYWTDKQDGTPAQNAGPVIKFGSNYRVDLYPNSQITVNNAGPLNDYGFTTNSAYLSDPSTNRPDVWIQNNTLHAKEGASGKFLLTYSSINNETGLRQLLAYEVVDVLQPVSATLERWVGDRLLPISQQYSTEELFAEITRGEVDESGSGDVFIYKHPEGIQQGWVWGIRETEGPAQVEIFWKAKEELDVVWPFEVDVYDLAWGGNAVATYARSTDPNNPGPPVYFSAEYTGVQIMPEQSNSLASDHASLDEDGNFISTSDGYCLLRYNTDDYIWFQSVHSVTDILPVPRTQDIASLVRPVDTNTYGAWPGFIYEGTPYNPNLYSYPAEHIETEASGSAIYGVNTGRVEAWWFEPHAQDLMPVPTYWPTARDDIDFVWPEAAPEIVVASGLGSEGLTIDTNDLGMLSITSAVPLDVTGSETLLGFDQDFTLEAWVNQAGGTGSLFMKDANYSLSLTSGYPVLTVNGLDPLSSSLALPAGAWSHVAASVSLTDGMRILVDGVPAGFAEVTGAIVNAGSGTLKLGDGLLGGYDEVRVWSYARSREQLRTYMHVPLNPDSPGLELYYAFNDQCEDAVFPAYLAPHPVPGIIEAEDYKLGGVGIAYYDLSPGSGGFTPYREPTDVDFAEVGVSGNVTNYIVGWVETNEWLAYDLDVSSNALYNLTFLVSTPYSGRVVHIEIDGVDATGPIPIPNTGDWLVYSNISGTVISLAEGEQTLRLVFDNGNINIDNFQVGNLRDCSSAVDSSANQLHSASVSQTPGGRINAVEGLSMIGANPSVYMQNDPLQPGFNPNEEHAFTLGDTVHALRTNFNSDATSSEPFVLVEYTDSAGQVDMAAYRVVMSNELYQFNQFLDAGLMLQAPAPLVHLQPSWADLNVQVQGPSFQDRTGRYWAYKAADDGGMIEYVFNLYYPHRPEFWYPDDDQPIDGALVPFEESPDQLVNYTYRVSWPESLPSLYIGDTLTEARAGLPAVRGQLSAEILYQQSLALSGDTRPSVHLVDPTVARKAALEEIPGGMLTQRDPATGFTFFTDLPPALRDRLYYNPFAAAGEELQLKGIYVERDDGYNYLQLNVLDRTNYLAAIDTEQISGITPDWEAAVYQLSTNTLLRIDHDYIPVDSYALPTAGEGEGYVTLVFNNSTNKSMVDPSEVVGMEIILVEPPLFNGRLDVIQSQNPLDQKLNVFYTADFAAEADKYEFKWEWADPENGLAPAETNDAAWNAFDLGEGLNNVTIGDSGVFGLSDHYLRCTYRAVDPTVQGLVGTNFVSWTPAQLIEGWIKRVLKAVNPYDQRIKDYVNYAILDELSMVQQAGMPYSGNVPLNYAALNEEGLIAFYQTLLVKARNLSIDPNIPAQNGLSLALLMAAGRLNDLYMVLGNEAYADAMNPTLNLGLNNNPAAASGYDESIYGNNAPSIFSFQNLFPTLLDEELALLRGRNDDFNPAVTTYPVFNRIPWNLTSDISGGQPAYVLNYGISDVNLDGNIDVLDAKSLYPQGHGDAWGHYLSAVKGYYELLRHDYFTWLPQVEGVLVGDIEATISYLHEKKFAVASAAKARAGEAIVVQEARRAYEVGTEPWETQRDEDENRAWGPAEWAARAGMGTYFDWLTVNSLLPSIDTNASHAGIQIIDRQTTLELPEMSDAFQSMQQTVDALDSGETPLGLAESAVPFDINPGSIDEGETHFEQVYNRAEAALQNAADIFHRSKDLAQALRDQNENLDYQRDIQEDEEGIQRKLIEIYGYPYSDDIGPGKIYDQDYNGPDLLHYMYIERSDLLNRLAGVTREVTFTSSVWVLNGTASTEFPRASMGELFDSVNGDLEPTNLAVNVFNYPGVDPNDPMTADVFKNGATVLTMEIPEWTRQTFEVSHNLGPYNIPVKPDTYSGYRRAEGKIQIALSKLFESIDQAYTAYEAFGSLTEKLKLELVHVQARADYWSVVDGFDAFFQEKMKDDSKLAIALEAAAAGLTRGADLAWLAAAAIAEAIPSDAPTAGAANSPGDVGAPGRGTALAVGVGIGIAMEATSQGLAGYVAQINQDLLDMEYDLGQALGGLEDAEERTLDLLRLRQAVQDLRIVTSELDTHHQAVESARMELSHLIAEGDYLQTELGRLRANHAADLTQKRYRNMAYRIFQNDALARYHEAYEHAARYVYLAAKAYDYETGLLTTEDGHTVGRSFMEDIVKARALGAFSDAGIPLAGGSVGDPGLADIMARMRANWDVLDGRLSFNNPQTETGRFSLRQELFRISPDASSDWNWRNTLEGYRVDNLLQVPEFKRYCLQFSPALPLEPGIVIPFSTEINFGKNFFGNTLAGGDNAYDSTYFSTKIRSAGVWFQNFDNAFQGGIANQPRVYLLPVGADRMRVPSVNGEQVRSWNVVDHALPVPYPLTETDWNEPDWSALKDMFGGNLFNIRRYPSMRAYHDNGGFNESEMISNSRLVGRSVWNTKWLLIIPGRTLLNDGDEGIERFIHGREVSPGIRDENGVKDIKLFFQTYSYSGN